jgi:hypothetical protein
VEQFHWNPDEYLALMRAEVPDDEPLQEELVAATRGADVRSILELGTGTGETPAGYWRPTRAHTCSASTRASQCAIAIWPSSAATRPREA